MKKIFLTILLSLILFPLQAQAQGACGGPIVPCGIDINGDGIIAPNEMCNFCHLFELLNNILRFLLTCLVPIIAVLMFTIGGVLFILSRFDIVSVDIFSKAKGTVTAVVVGLVIIFASWIFLNVFLSTIGIATWTGLDTWWEISCSACPACGVCEECNEDTRECAPQDSNWGDDNYSCMGPNSRCEAGVCVGGACTTCAECTSSDYCEEASRDCLDLPTCRECNADFGYSNVAAGTSCGTCRTCNASGQCTAMTTSLGDNDYGCTGSNSYCAAGTCVTVECINCAQCGGPTSGEYCRASDNTCVSLPTCRECNADFGYSNVAAGTSCGTCRTCNASGQCTAMTTPPDAGLYGCTGSSMMCLNGVCRLFIPPPPPPPPPMPECLKGSDCPSGEYCYVDPIMRIPPILPSCKPLPVCRQRNENTFGYISAPDTGWGDNLYGCNGSDKRCYGGSCRTCGGYIYDDGCSGCSAPSGSPSTLACWRYGADPGMAGAYTCDSACNSYGGCIQENWNDDTNCSVCRNWWSSGNCTVWLRSFVPIYRNVFWINQCNYRPPSTTQNCSARGNEGFSRRLCVCNY